MLIEVSGSVAAALLGLAAGAVANIIAVVRVFHRLEQKLAVIRTRLGYIERGMGLSAHADDDTGI